MKAVRFHDTSDYQYLSVKGIEGVFTPLRIRRDSLPEGFNKYSFRDGENSFLGSVAKDILVNHAGDFITKQSLDLGPDGELPLGEEDVLFQDKTFDFEEYFGVKLSIDRQIEMAEEKRNGQISPNRSKGPEKSGEIEPGQET